jgi:hypothetical protein
MYPLPVAKGTNPIPYIPVTFLSGNINTISMSCYRQRKAFAKIKLSSMALSIKCNHI